MSNGDLRTELLNEFKRIEEIIKKENVNGSVSRDFFRQHSSYPDTVWASVFGTFSRFKSVASSTDIKRESFNKVKDDSKKTEKRKYFVTSAIAGAELDKSFFDSVLTYCKHNKAELVILPMRGIRLDDAGYTEDILTYAHHFATEYQFNENLKAQDFLINPQMINPLTGLDRFGQKSYSLIIASPKQFMKIVPVSHETFPHILHSTGSITLPRYASTRQGRLAEQDHCRGGLIVEIEDETVFHIRQVQSSEDGSFYDLGTLYSKNKIIPNKASAIVLGDMHTGFEEKSAIDSWIELIKLTNPKYIVLHDIFDAHSISHHHINNIERQVNRKDSINSLEKELHAVGESLTKWSKLFPKKTLVIVRSNHDEALDKYLYECRYKDDRLNHRLALHLAAWYLEGHNPLEKWVTENYNIPNVMWLKREKDYKLYNIMISAHGDKKAHSIWGSSTQIAELAYGNAVIAHSHSPLIFRNIWRVGTTTQLIMDYNKGAPSNWLHCSCLIYKNQQRQLVISIDGKWKL